MLLTLGNPPAAVQFDIFIMIAHGIQDQLVLTIFFGAQGGNSITDTVT